MTRAEKVAAILRLVEESLDSAPGRRPGDWKTEAAGNLFILDRVEMEMERPVEVFRDYDPKQPPTAILRGSTVMRAELQFTTVPNGDAGMVDGIEDDLPMLDLIDMGEQWAVYEVSWESGFGLESRRNPIDGNRRAKGVIMVETGEGTMVVRMERISR